MIKTDNIIIICGANSCGKSTTIKGFFGIDEHADAPEYNEKSLSGKTVCAVSLGVTFGSPQEQSPFCNFERVWENITIRISICDRKAKSRPYYCLIPFTISGSRKEKKKVNRDCIIKPIAELRKRYNVFVVYLKKTNTHNLKEKNELVEEIALIQDVEVIRPPILTTKKDYNKSIDLEKVLSKIILKSSPES